MKTTDTKIKPLTLSPKKFMKLIVEDSLTYKRTFTNIKKLKLKGLENITIKYGHSKILVLTDKTTVFIVCNDKDIDKDTEIFVFDLENGCFETDCVSKVTLKPLYKVIENFEGSFEEIKDIKEIYYRLYHNFLWWSK